MKQVRGSIGEIVQAKKRNSPVAAGKFLGSYREHCSHCPPKSGLWELGWDAVNL